MDDSLSHRILAALSATPLAVTQAHLSVIQKVLETDHDLTMIEQNFINIVATPEVSSQVKVNADAGLKRIQQVRGSTK